MNDEYKANSLLSVIVGEYVPAYAVNKGGLSQFTKALAIAWAQCNINVNAIHKMFKFPIKVGKSSVFNGTGFEWRKNPFLGKCGHIAIGTKNIEVAIAYLARKGIYVKEETQKQEN